MKIRIISVLLYLCALSNAFLLPDDHQIRYSYRGCMTASSPESKKFSSKYEIFAKIVIENGKSGAIISLQDVKYTLYSGKGDEDNEDLNKVDLSEEAQVISLPFFIPPNNEEKPPKMLMHKNDESWSIKIKRSIALLLYVDKHALAGKERTQMVDENFEFGVCPVRYTLQKIDEEHTLLHKNTDSNYCRNLIFGLDFNQIPSSACESSVSDPVYYSFLNKYVTIAKKKIGTYVNSVEAENHLTYTQFGKHTDGNYILVNQTILLESIDKKDTENVINTDKEFSNYEINDSKSSNVTQNIELIVKRVYRILKEVVNHIDTMEIQLSKVSNYKENVASLISELKYLDESHLNGIYTKLKQGSVGMLEMFLETLPSVGTKASTMVIRSLILNKNIGDLIAKRLLMNMERAFKYQNNTHNFVKEFEDLTNENVNISEQIKNTATLTFASMLRVFPTMYHVDSVSEYDVYVNKYSEKLIKATSYKDQFLLINALNNMITNRESIIMNKIIGGQKPYDNFTSHLRSLAILSLFSSTKTTFRGKPADDLLMPILMDKNEDIELRLTTLYALTRMDINLRKIFWYLRSEKNEDLRNLYYTTLVSFSESSVECYKNKLEFIKYLFKIIRKPTNKRIGSFNYFFDYVNILRNFGAVTNVVQFGDLNLYKFETTFIQFSTNVNNALFDQTGLYFHLRRHKNLDKHIKLDFGIFATPSDELTIEFIMLRGNSVILANIYGANELFMLLTNFKEAISELTSYRLHPVESNEITLNTEIGIPISFYIRKSTAQSQKLNYDDHPRYTDQIYRVSLDFRQWDHLEHGIKVYNPIADVWHGIRHVQTVDTHLAFDASAKNTHDIQTYGVDLILPDENTTLGFQSTEYSEVYIGNDDFKEALQKSCAQCQSTSIVMNEEFPRKNYTIWHHDNKFSGLLYRFEIFDCDEQTMQTYIIQLQNLFKNRMFSPKDLYLNMQQFWDYVSITPGSETCGIGLRIERSETYPTTHINIKLEMERFDNDSIETASLGSADLKVSFKCMHGNNTRSSFDFNMTSYKKTFSDFDINMSLKDTTPEVSPQNHICMHFSKHLKAEVLTAKLEIMSRNESTECDYTMLQMDMKGKLSKEQQEYPQIESKLYEECADDSMYLFDICLSKVTALREYEFDFNFTNVPKYYHKLWWYVTDYMRTSHVDAFFRTNQTEYEIESGTMKMMLKYPLASNEVDVSVMTQSESFDYRGLPLDDKYWPYLFQPYSVYTFNNINLNNYCEIGISQFQHMLNNSRSSYNLPDKWVLILGTCKNDTCEWGIYAKKVYGTDDSVALRVVVEEETMVLHKENDIQIHLNEKHIETSQK
ncbi:uncharacterized protein LOC143911222 [Arctopsyche grandis]|uniref:uncharacterized protein LOC143911222 n=1 Tax=Arctopsyche grandis TaxID=121162 RepID=UPI00406D6B03